jgi:hypothetical protein
MRASLAKMVEGLCGRNLGRENQDSCSTKLSLSHVFPGLEDLPQSGGCLGIRLRCRVCRTLAGLPRSPDPRHDFIHCVVNELFA